MQQHHNDEFSLRTGLFNESEKQLAYPQKQAQRKANHHDEFQLYSQALVVQAESDLPETQAISIAYFLMVHRFPEQFKRMFEAIYHPNNHYLIHVDQKAEVAVQEELEFFLKDFPNSYILKSEKVVWGGYSMVQSELDGMNFLLNLELNWDFFINLSGQDFPLKSQAYLHSFLAANRQTSFLKFANQITDRPETMNRIDNYFEEDAIGFPTLSHKRDFLADAIPFIGGQWMILTRECCDFLCNSEEMKKFEDYYRHTLIADEAFFQTALMNSSFGGKLMNDDKRAIIWIPDGDIKLRPKTFTEADLAFLNEGDNLFARKFDENEDSNILYILEAKLIETHDFVDNLISAGAARTLNAASKATEMPLLTNKVLKPLRMPVNTIA